MTVAARRSTSGVAGRRRLLAIAAAVAIVLTAGSVLAAIVRGPASEDQRPPSPGIEEPAVGTIPTTRPSMAAASASASAAPAAPEAIGFDRQRIGQLDASELPSARVIGAPEVAAFPTPFNRSLRLTGPSSAICVSTSGTPSAISLDIYLGEGGDEGRLGFRLSPADADGSAIELNAIEGVDGEGWHHLAVIRTGDAAVLSLTPIEGGAPAIEVPLIADGSVIASSPGEACVEWSTGSTGASIYIDDVRVDD